MNVEDSKTAALYAMGIIGIIIVGIVVFLIAPELVLGGILVVIVIHLFKWIAKDL